MGINWGWGGQGSSGAASVTNEGLEETDFCTLFYPQSSPQNLNSPFLKLTSLLKICKSWIFFHWVEGAPMCLFLNLYFLLKSFTFFQSIKNAIVLRGCTLRSG